MCHGSPILSADFVGQLNNAGLQKLADFVICLTSALVFSWVGSVILLNMCIFSRLLLQLQECCCCKFSLLLLGIRGQLHVIVKVDLFTDSNKFRQSSCGVRFFCSKFAFLCFIFHRLLNSVVN